MKESVNKTPEEQWQAVKRIRKTYVPRHIALKENGRVTSYFQRAQAFANHLQNKQWAYNRNDEQKRIDDEYHSNKDPLGPQLPIPISNYTMDELDEAVLGLKKDKATGTDKIQNELIMLLNYENREPLKHDKQVSQHQNHARSMDRSNRSYHLQGEEITRST